MDGLLAVWRAVDDVLEPDDPPMPRQELRGDLFGIPATSAGASGWRRSTASPPAWPTPTRTSTASTTPPSRSTPSSTPSGGAGASARALLRAALAPGRRGRRHVARRLGARRRRRGPVPPARPDPPVRGPVQPGARRWTSTPTQQRRWTDDAPGRAGRLPPRRVGGDVPRRVGRSALADALAPWSTLRSTTSTGTRRCSRPPSSSDRAAGRGRRGVRRRDHAGPGARRLGGRRHASSWRRACARPSAGRATPASWRPTGATVSGAGSRPRTCAGRSPTSPASR